MTETSAHPLRTPAEAAQRLNVTPEQVIGFAHDGELHYVNVGRGSKRPRYRFTDADIDELIEKRKQRGAYVGLPNGEVAPILLVRLLHQWSKVSWLDASDK